jgi:hypothetical protein
MHFSFSKLNVFQNFSSDFVNGVDRIGSKDAKMFLKISFNELASFFVHNNGSNLIAKLNIFNPLSAALKAPKQIVIY